MAARGADRALLVRGALVLAVFALIVGGSCVPVSVTPVTNGATSQVEITVAGAHNWHATSAVDSSAFRILRRGTSLRGHMDLRS